MRLPSNCIARAQANMMKTAVINSASVFMKSQTILSVNIQRGKLPKYYLSDPDKKLMIMLNKDDGTKRGLR